MTACPVNAIAIDPKTGAKVVMDNVCVGCAVCTVACPYGTVFYNPDTHNAFKYDLCGGDPVGGTQYAALPTIGKTHQDVD
jgi:anaerobic carbon-monoxide dehydrogenase iron sulfur subunit